MRSTYQLISFSLLLSLVIFLSSCAINSTLTIPASEAFVLGGNGNGRFKAQLENTGILPVVIASESESGTLQILDTLQPGAKTRARFPKGAAAILTNVAADKSAVVKVQITGSLNLGMVYQEVPQ